jgi:hypothetical protein
MRRTHGIQEGEEVTLTYSTVHAALLHVRKLHVRKLHVRKLHVRELHVRKLHVRKLSRGTSRITRPIAPHDRLGSIIL